MRAASRISRVASHLRQNCTSTSSTNWSILEIELGDTPLAWKQAGFIVFCLQPRGTQQLQRALESNRIRLISHYFWTQKPIVASTSRFQSSRHQGWRRSSSVAYHHIQASPSKQLHCIRWNCSLHAKSTTICRRNDADRNKHPQKQTTKTNETKR